MPVNPLTRKSDQHQISPYNIALNQALRLRE